MGKPMISRLNFLLYLLYFCCCCLGKKDRVDLGGDPTYHRHRTKRTTPAGQAIDPETQLMQSLPETSAPETPATETSAQARTQVAPAAAETSTMVSSSFSYSSSAPLPAANPDASAGSSSSSSVLGEEEQEGKGDSRTMLDSTGEVGIGDFKDGHEKVKTYQVYHSYSFNLLLLLSLLL